ncbi:hypothetical protein VTK73DRAFT_3518 [Phialemonium thermophilum]|uniref:Uncharacterized protein n=1 Tax=Phialemonium thermophilum TaxID=223376 RepID=A0ABR3VHJ4_9PEZI
MRHKRLLKAESPLLQRPHTSPIRSADDAAHFCRDCTVVVRQSERVGGHNGLGPKDAEVNQRRTRCRRGRSAGDGQHATGCRIELVPVCGQVYEAGKLVLVWSVPPVPGHDVKRRMVLFVGVEFAAHLDDNLPWRCLRTPGTRRTGALGWGIQVEARYGVLEVSGMCQAIGTERSKIWKFEVRTERLESIACSSRLPIWRVWGFRRRPLQGSAPNSKANAGGYHG